MCRTRTPAVGDALTVAGVPSAAVVVSRRSAALGRRAGSVLRAVGVAIAAAALVGDEDLLADGWRRSRVAPAAERGSDGAADRVTEHEVVAQFGGADPSGHEHCRG